MEWYYNIHDIFVSKFEKRLGRKIRTSKMETIVQTYVYFKDFLKSYFLDGKKMLKKGFSLISKPKEIM